MKTRLATGVFAALAVFAFGLVPSAQAAVASAPPAPVLSRVTIPEAAEYFTDVWADPMDMSNPEDFDTTPHRRSPGINTSMANGVLNYHQWWGAGRLYFTDSAPNELVVLEHREATHRPIDSSRYTRLAVRAYTDRNITGFIVWDHCAGQVPGGACQGTKAFNLRAGWHTYDLDLTGANDSDSYTDAGQPNSIAGTPCTQGPIVRLAWQPSAAGVSGVQGVIDSVRVYQPGTATVGVTNSGATANLWHDNNSNTADNGTATNQGSGAGVLRHNLGPGQSTVDLGALVPGAYHLDFEIGGDFSAPSPAVTIDPAPRPVVLDPDVAGEGDWFEATRGEGNDYSNVADTFTMFDGLPNVRNAEFGVFGGQLHAHSAGLFDDPQVYLTDAFWNGPVLDAEEWHRITWRITYDGTWGTNQVPGEGLDTRFCWFLANGPATCSKDVFPVLGPQTYSVDLKTANPADVENVGQSGLGFGGPLSRWVHLLRFDPHEDPGMRSWHLDDIRIAHDDRIPYGGSFPIRFEDRAHQAGSTAEVFVDTDPWLGNGASNIANVNVAPGVNTVHWSGADFPPARYWVHVKITDPLGNRRTHTSTGPVDLPDPAKWSPFGTLEAVEGRKGYIYLRGWSIDPSWVRDPTDVHVSIDGHSIDLGPANQAHLGIGLMRTDAGPWHGFDRQIPAAPGAHDVCVYAINFGHGAHTGMGCRTVVVK